MNFILQRGRLVLETLRYSSEALEATGLLDRSRVSDSIKIEGFGLRLCMREAWACIGLDLIQVAVRLPIRCCKDDEYASLEDLQCLGSAVKDGKSKVSSRKSASGLYASHAKKAQIPNASARAQVRKGKARVRSAGLKAEKDLLTRRHTRSSKR